MNRWTGTGHLTKDPKFLETESGTAICTLRIAVKRAGKQGHDGYFDVKCFDAQAHACARVPEGRARGRRSTAACSSTSSRPRTAATPPASTSSPSASSSSPAASRSNGQASDEASPEQPATDGAAREAHPAA